MANPHRIFFCVYFIHHPIRTCGVFLITNRPACFSYIALSYLGRQNELTFAGAISQPCPKSESSVLIRLFFIRGPNIYQVPGILYCDALMDILSILYAKSCGHMQVWPSFIESFPCGVFATKYILSFIYIYIQYYCLTNQNSSWESGSFCPQFRSTLITCTL